MIVLQEDQTVLTSYLEDLARYGVTDFAADAPFDFYAAPKQTSPTSQPHEAVVSKPLKPATQQTPQTKPWEQPLTSTGQTHQVATNNQTVWHVGCDAGQASLQVIAYRKTQNDTQPFDVAATQLFSKMMSAIGQEMSSISYILHSETHNMANTLLQNLNTQKPILIVGQDSADALTGKTLTQLREDTTIKGLEHIGVIIHPNLLLKQPVLKRTAWQDLLKFTKTTDGGAH